MCSRDSQGRRQLQARLDPGSPPALSFPWSTILPFLGQVLCVSSKCGHWNLGAFSGLCLFSFSLSLSEPIFKTSWWTVSHSCSHSVTRALPCVLVGQAWATRSFLQPAGTTWDQKRQFPSETTGCWTDRRKGPQQRLSREAF